MLPGSAGGTDSMATWFVGLKLPLLILLEGGLLVLGNAYVCGTHPTESYRDTPGSIIETRAE